MFCKECGQEIEKDSKFCSFCGTRLFFGPIINVKNNSSSEPITIIVKGLDKYDRTYKGDGEATVVGIISTILNIVLFLYSKNNKEVQIIAGSIGIVLWIIFIFWVVSISDKQNRNSLAWGIFAFFIPVLALIIIGMLKKLKNDSFNTDSIDQPSSDQVSSTKHKEFLNDTFFRQIKFTETFTNKIKSFMRGNSNEFLIKFSDGKSGKIFYNETEEKFHLIDKGKYIYYNSKESTIYALYLYLTDSEITQIDQLAILN